MKPQQFEENILEVKTVLKQIKIKVFLADKKRRKVHIFNENKVASHW